MELSIVIPAYNEEKRILKTLKTITESLKNLKFEIIVVDDGSTDHTRSIVESYNLENIRLLKNEKNMGKGYSVKKGVLAAEGSHILITDADMSTPITEVSKLLAFSDRYLLIVGSRNLPESRIYIRQGITRVTLGRVFSYLPRLLRIVDDVSDTQCGFKLIRSDAAKKLFRSLRIHGFAYDVEMLLTAKRNGISYTEVPVIWNNDPNSKVNILKHSPRMLLDLLIIKFGDTLGRYKNVHTQED
jgi:dolichyl-phosphate beta-glucosyltransferase